MKGFKTLIKLALPLALGIGVYEYLLRRALPKVSGTLRLRGLEGRVEVLRDKWGVPHIYAATARDAFFAQGYVHAQDRLWQMEFQRRVGAGRLSEIFGGKALEADRFLRRVGMHRAAAVEAGSLADEARETLEAYAAGVNAYIEGLGRNLPLEYTVLHIRPEPWRAVDSLMWAKTMAWGLSANWETELLRARLVALVGPEEAARLEPCYPCGHPLVIPAGVDYAGIGDQLLAAYQEIKDLMQISSEAVGSNNWVVDGVKSETGKPLLANDPHLLPLAPPMWYEVHLSAPGLSVIGASLPGAPGVVIGHNGRIAWGITNSVADVQDLYVERFSADDPDLYQFQGTWERAQVIREEIAVRGRARPAVEEVKITRHGPIITPIGPAQASPLALRWVGLDRGDMVSSALKLNRATNWNEFTAALALWNVPSQNFVYADVEGNIGYYLAGKIPIRAKGNGMFPVPGWTGEYEWTGYIPPEDLPQAFNPESHFLATANNKVVAEEYPHHISCEWHSGYRARRIGDLILSKESLSVEDFKRFQGDCYSLPCVEAARHLLSLPPRDRWQEDALRRVAAWDGHLSRESVGGAICQVFLWRLQARVFGPKVPGLLDEYLGAGFHPVVPTNAFLGGSTPFLLDLLERGDDRWFDVSSHPEEGKDCRRGSRWQTEVEESFAEAIVYLRRTLGQDVAGWQWGRLHRLSFAHVFSQIKPLHLLFNRGPYPVSGDGNTVCQTAYLPSEAFQAKSSPSYRQIIDLADFRNSLMMHAPGQSGHLASRHYDDLVKPWRAVQYHPMLFEQEDVLAGARSTLYLFPFSPSPLNRRSLD